MAPHLGEAHPRARVGIHGQLCARVQEILLASCKISGDLDSFSHKVPQMARSGGIHLYAQLVRRARGEGEGLVELGVEVVVHHLGLEGGPAAAHLHVRVGAVPEVGRLVLCDPDPVCRKVAVTGQCQGRGGSGLRGSPALRMFSALMTFTTTFRRRWDCPDFSFKLQNSSNEISPGK